MTTKEKGERGRGGEPKKLMVAINSLDGNIPHHPFDPSATVGDVRQFAYERLVKQKDQIALDRTWIEFASDRVENNTPLGTLAKPDESKGSEPDLTLSLVWDTSGGGANRRWTFNINVT